jgi:hypothetical protein
MNPSQVSSVRIFVALTFSILMLPFGGDAVFGQAQSGKAVTSSVLQSNGMRIVKFEPPGGSVAVSFPDDLVASDTISGAVIATPRANSAVELASNAEELHGYTLELINVGSVGGRAGHKGGSGVSAPMNTSIESAHAHNFSCVIPAVGDHIQLVLKDKDRKVVATQDIPFGPKPTAGSTKQNALVLPSDGECGQPIRIEGDFSGSYTSSHVTIGGQACTIQAESPRRLICVTPKGVVGRTTIQLRSAGKAAKAKFNNKLSTTAANADLLEVSGGWTGTPGPITIVQSGPFVTWDTGSIKYWGTVGKDSLDFEFHNYRYESRGKGHLVAKKVKGYKEYLDGYYAKTSVNNKPVSNPKHTCHLYRQ